MPGADIRQPRSEGQCALAFRSAGARIDDYLQCRKSGQQLALERPANPLILVLSDAKRERRIIPRVASLRRSYERPGAIDTESLCNPTTR